MNFSDNYGADPNYVGSSLKPTKFYQEVNPVRANSLSVLTEHEKWVGEVTNFTTQITDEDFVQPAGLWNVIKKEPGHQDRFFGNVAVHLSQVKHQRLRNDVYGMPLYQFQEKSMGRGQADSLCSVVLPY